MVEWLARLASGVGDLVNGLPPGVRLALGTVCLFLLAYLATAAIVRRVVPWAVARVLEPAAVALVGGVGLALLAVDVLVVLPFRVVVARPPAPVYALGDAVAASTSWVQRSLRDLGRRVALLRFVRGRIIAVVVVLAVLVWNRASCLADSGSASCTRPAAAAADAVTSGAAALWRLVTETLW
jgi:hypothetical protein